ncbi:MAG: hypothetical protein ACRDC4_06020 [Plesiomonas sp.]
MPIYTPKSFAYQEVPNDFTDNRQTINGQQIVSVKKFRKQAPDVTERPDYVGQIGVGSRDDGTPLVYVSGASAQSVNGWDLVSTGPYSDVFANKDKANNFSNANQTILNNQIPFIQQGFVSVDNIPIKGQGHIYIDMSTVSQPKVFLAAVATGGGYEWVRITDHTEIDNVAMKNEQNNFKDGRQTILNQSIASVNPSISRPAAPVRSGEMYLKKGDPSKGEKPQLWIASSTATGAFEWTPVSHSLDEDVVYRNVPNNFTHVNQTIIGKQVMSFATRGDQTPQGYKADYDGQFYIAFKTLSGGAKDAAVWVANGGTWVPLTSNVDPTKVVMTDKENEFTVAKQGIKNGAELSQITGARIKVGGSAPNADTSYKATMIGEVCIYKNDTTTPSQVSVWVAVSINPSALSNAGEWTMIYSSVADPTKYARTDKENTFEKTQKIIGFGNHPCDVMKSRIVDDESSPVGRIVPFSIGETFMIHREPVPGPGAKDEFEVYLSTKVNDSNSWLKIYDKPIDKIVRSNEPTFFTDKLYLGDVNNTKKLRITGAREKTDGTVYNTTLPLQLGETVMCTERVGTEDWIVIYMCAMDQSTVPAGQKSRKNWIEIGRRKKSELIHK